MSKRIQGYTIKAELFVETDMMDPEGTADTIKRVMAAKKEGSLKGVADIAGLVMLDMGVTHGSRDRAPIDAAKSEQPASEPETKTEPEPDGAAAAAEEPEPDPADPAIPAGRRPRTTG